MIKIFVKNVKSVLSEYTEELEELLAVKHDGYFFSPKYKKGLWDGKTHFLTVPALKFPTGLLFLVTEYFKEKDMKYSIADLRKPFDAEAMVKNPKCLNGITLRDYQMEAINRGLIYKRGIFEVATGLGKTEIAIGITQAVRLKTLFIVHTQDLLHQTHDRFAERIGLRKKDIGIIGDGEFEVDSDIVIATIQSLDRKLFEKNEQGRSVLNKKTGEEMKWLLNTFNIMFQDETHHSSATTWYRIGMFMHNAYYRFGLSGTPLRRSDLSNMKVMAVTGGVIYSKLAEEGIEEGFLSNIEVKILENPNIVYEKTWRKIYAEGIVRSGGRNLKLANAVSAEWDKGKKIMILVRYIEHGKILQKMLESFSIPAVFLSGKDASLRREEIKKKFSLGDNFVLIASSIYDEGIDIPEINVLVHAAGGKSEVKTIQKTGRGLRLKKNNEGLTVYDFDDVNIKFLKKHSKNRIKTYKQEGFLK